MEHPIQIVRFGVLVAALLLPVQVMALTVDQRGQGVAIGSGTTLTMSFTVNSVSPFFVQCTASQDTSGVTWDGVAMDVVQSSLIDSGVAARTAVFGQRSPTTGTHNVVATFAASVSFANCFAVSTTGGDTTTGWRSVYTRIGSTGGAGPGTTVANSQPGDLVLHAAHVFASTITFDAGEDTTSTEDDAIGGGSRSAGLSTQTATVAGTAVGCTDVTYYVEIAFSVIPASGGGTSTHNLMMMGVGQ